MRIGFGSVGCVDPPALIRAARERHGLSVARLALRAGVRPQDVERFERGEELPPAATLEALLLAVGERVDPPGERLASTHDAGDLAAERLRSPSERLERALAWNRFASAIAGTARREEKG